MKFEPTHSHLRIVDLANQGRDDAAISRLLGVSREDVSRMRAEMRRGAVSDLAKTGEVKVKPERKAPIKDLIIEFMTRAGKPVTALTISQAIGEERPAVSVYLRQLQATKTVKRVTGPKKKPGRFALIKTEPA